MSAQTFESFLTFKLGIACIAAYLFYKFARRDATAFDTIYRKRIRYAYVVLFGASVIYSIIQVFYGPFTFSLPWYNLSLYGTPHPTDAMLEFGHGLNANIHPTWETCKWSRLTFEQWSLSTGIADIIVGCGAIIYILRFRRSSVRWHVKLRKFIGYTLLFTAHATIANTLHYFTWDELIVVAIYIGLIYLFCRSYKWDAVPTKLPKESISHPNVQEFEAIPPEDKSRIGIKDYISISKEDIREDIQALRQKVHDSKKIQWLFLGATMLLAIVLTILFVYRYQERPRGYGIKQYCAFNLWIEEAFYDSSNWSLEECNVDYSLGTPTNGNQCLSKTRMEVSHFSGFPDPKYEGKTVYEKYRRHEIITYDITSLGYDSHDSRKYLEDVERRYHGRIYVCEKANNERCVAYRRAINFQEEIYIATEKIPEVIIAAAAYGKHVSACNQINVYHQIFCIGKYAYEIRTYSFKDVEQEPIIAKIYFHHPRRVLNNCIYVILSLLLIFLLAWIIAFVIIARQKKAINKNAKFLLWYNFASIVLQIIFMVVCSWGENLTDSYDPEISTSFVILSLGLSIINVPSLVYIIRKNEEEYAIEYLLPNWYKECVSASFKNQSVWNKISVVLIMYPLLYVATLPCGIFVLLYLIPISAIIGILYLIHWIFEDSKPLAETHKKKQPLTRVSSSPIEKLRELKGMLDEGLISKDDYDRKKAEILDKIQ